MGERLGRVDSLILQGIMPIHPDEGVRILLERLRSTQPATALVVTGRFGEPPTLKSSQPELPLHRFLERRRAYYPGVEVVVDAELSRQTDPYLDDHIVHEERLLPAVLGLEGMAQIPMSSSGFQNPAELRAHGSHRDRSRFRRREQPPFGWRPCGAGPAWSRSACGRR